jgi:hypothetical protein
MKEVGGGCSVPFGFKANSLRRMGKEGAEADLTYDFVG